MATAVIRMKYGEHCDVCRVKGEEEIAKCENSNGDEPRIIRDKRTIKCMLISGLYSQSKAIKKILRVISNFKFMVRAFLVATVEPRGALEEQLD